jgi:hypothetical protein
MKVNRIPRITCTVNDLGEREIHSAATTSAMNTGSDQAIEYIFKSDGLNAMMANAEIVIGVRMFAFSKINLNPLELTDKLI